MLFLLHCLGISASLARLVYRIRTRRFWWDDFWAFVAVLSDLVFLMAFSINGTSVFSPICNSPLVRLPFYLINKQLIRKILFAYVQRFFSSRCVQLSGIRGSQDSYPRGSNVDIMGIQNEYCCCDRSTCPSRAWSTHGQGRRSTLFSDMVWAAH